MIHRFDLGQRTCRCGQAITPPAVVSSSTYGPWQKKAKPQQEEKQNPQPGSNPSKEKP